MRTAGGTGWRRVVALAVLLAVAAAPARADDDEVVPGSCKLHDGQVVNPGCVPALLSRVTDPPETYPDLVPDVRQVLATRPIVDVVNGTLVFGDPALAFDTWAQNLGTVDLELVSEDPADLDSPAVAQCVAWTADVCRKRRPVGGFHMHEGHAHFHFEEFARYELRSLLADGTPDHSEAGLLALSEKVSFCLLDSQRVKEDGRRAPTYESCTATREGISYGWADVYASQLQGQQLTPAGGLVDGRYALIVTINWGGNVYESDDGNNVLEVTVEVTNGATHAVVLGKNRP